MARYDSRKGAFVEQKFRTFFDRSQPLHSKFSLITFVESFLLRCFHRKVLINFVHSIKGGKWICTDSSLLALMVLRLTPYIMSFKFTQHMPKEFEQMLSNIFNALTPLIIYIYIFFPINQFVCSGCFCYKFISIFKTCQSSWQFICQVILTKKKIRHEPLWGKRENVRQSN